MIELNYRDARPIYEQIKDGLRKLMLSSVIRQDEKLPSVRELASQLAINPNTIQKAYRELEQEGYIYTVSGRGSFAAPFTDINSGRLKKLLNQFDEAVIELLYMKKDPKELQQRIVQLQQGGAGYDRSY
ncbi:MAG: GntR family transcriptional regulator [Eubacterium sp.]|nr:GntR family transcriptional regulator [Eubacterium sp.]MCI8918816.1 GntR family transcriptional regulator [Eubacterium sp.]